MGLIDKTRMAFCNHDWECIDKTTVCDWTRKELCYRGLYEKPTSDAKLVPIGHKWTYMCKKCGKFRVDKNY